MPVDKLLFSRPYFHASYTTRMTLCVLTNKKTHTRLWAWYMYEHIIYTRNIFTYLTHDPRRACIAAQIYQWWCWYSMQIFAATSTFIKKCFSNTLQQNATSCNTGMVYIPSHVAYESAGILRLWHTHYNTLQHTASYCNTLQHRSCSYTHIKRLWMRVLVWGCYGA